MRNRCIVKKIKKMVRTFDRICGGPKKEKSSPTQTIEAQVNQIMSIPDQEEVHTIVNKIAPSKNKSLSRILQYTLRENTPDLRFLAEISAIYSRMILRRTLNKLPHLGCKTPKVKAKKLHNRPTVTEEYKQYIRLGMEKMYMLLLTNNANFLEETEEYRRKYNKKHFFAKKNK